MQEIFTSEEWEKTLNIIKQTASALAIYSREGNLITGDENLPFKATDKPDVLNNILFLPAEIDGMQVVLASKPIISIDKAVKITQKAIELLNTTIDGKDKYEQLQTTYSYLQSVSMTKSTTELIQATAEFLIHKLKLANCTIQLADKKYRYFETTNTYEPVERIIQKQTQDTRVTNRIRSIQDDFLLEKIESTEQLPKAVFSIPLMTRTRYAGTIFCYSDEIDNKKITQAETVAKEFINNVGKLTELQEARANAQTDALTGLLNRSKLITYLEQEIKENARKGMPTSLLIFDIDDFKKYNDTYGHPAGDEVLKQVAEQTRKINAPTFRYGGEEFVTLLGGMDSIRTKEMAEKLREDIEKNCALTISIGCITCNNSTLTAKNMIEEADKALYRAKATGKNKVVQFIAVDKSLGIVDASKA